MRPPSADVSRELAPIVGGPRKEFKFVDFCQARRAGAPWPDAVKFENRTRMSAVQKLRKAGEKSSSPVARLMISEVSTYK